MNLKNSVVLIVLLVLNTSIFSQSKTQVITKSPTDSKTVNPTKEESKVPDFKILASTQSYIEIEFTPQYINSNFDFNNSQVNGKKYGEPDLRFRSFPVYLTSQINNKIEIVDSKFELVNNADVKPIPTP